MYGRGKNKKKESIIDAIRNLTTHISAHIFIFASVSSTCKQYALLFFSIVAVAASSCSGKSSNILIAFKYPIYFSSQFLFFLSIWLLEIFLFRRITSFIS